MVYLYAGRQAQKPAFSYMKECRQKLPQIGRAYRHEGPQRRPKEYARPDQGRQEGKARQTGRQTDEEVERPAGKVLRRQGGRIEQEQGIQGSRL